MRGNEPKTHHYSPLFGNRLRSMNHTGPDRTRAHKEVKLSSSVLSCAHCSAHCTRVQIMYALCTPVPALPLPPPPHRACSARYIVHPPGLAPRSMAAPSCCLSDSRPVTRRASLILLMACRGRARPGQARGEGQGQPRPGQARGEGICRWQRQMQG